MPSNDNKRLSSIMSYFQVKYLVLLLLVVQNTFFVLLMRYSRTRPGDLYLSSTAVCCDEAMKLITCSCIMTCLYFFGNNNKEKKDLCEAKGGNDFEPEADHMNTDTTGIHQSFCAYMKEELHFDFRIAGIALLFIVQKNLLYLAVSNLDAAVFQVTYQLKILTTALCSVLLLKRTLSYQKIAALILLTLGAALVQLDKVQDNASISFQQQSHGVGLVAVLGACCTSGFAGVYFESVLKPRHDNDKQTQPRPIPSVWATYVQLSAFGLLIGLAGAWMKDSDSIRAKGFFQGYNSVVLGVIALQAFGGLVVAATIKYADNILKNFATAVSIVTSTIVGASVFGFSVSTLFVWGSVLQFIAIYLYAMKDEAKLSTQISYFLRLLGSSTSTYIRANTIVNDAAGSSGKVKKCQGSNTGDNLTKTGRPGFWGVSSTMRGTKDDGASTTSDYTEFPPPLRNHRSLYVRRCSHATVLFVAMAAMSVSIVLYFEAEEDYPSSEYIPDIQRGGVGSGYEEVEEVSMEPGERKLPLEGGIDMEPLSLEEIETHQLRVNARLKERMKQRILERQRVQLGTAHIYDGGELTRSARNTAQTLSQEEIEMRQLRVDARLNERMKRIQERQRIQRGQQRRIMMVQDQDPFIYAQDEAYEYGLWIPVLGGM